MLLAKPIGALGRVGRGDAYLLLPLSCFEIKIQHPQWDLSCVYSQMQKWRETPKRLRHGGKKVEFGQTHIFPELQIGQKA